MAYRLYLFDFDYTLVNSEKGILGCFHLTNQALGYPDCDDDTMRRTIGLPMVQAVFRAVPGIPEEKIRPYLNQYRQFANQIMTANTFFFPETLPALRILRERGAKIGVISSKTHHRIQEKFDLDGAHDLLDFVVGSDDVTAAKPDPKASALRSVILTSNRRKCSIRVTAGLTRARQRTRALRLPQ